MLRQTLTSDVAFDFDGEFYKFEQAFSAVKPASDAGIPIYFGGQSPIAVEVGAQHADVFMLFGEPLEQTAERIGLIREAAARHGRTVEFSLSTRPIVAPTEDAAWQRAQYIYDNALGRQGAVPALAREYATSSTAISRQRLQDLAAKKEVYDERLWFGITKLTGPGGNSTAHVGTPDQVAEALLQYYDIGVSKFLIRGFDPLKDVVDWGQELIPRIREGARARAVSADA